MSDPLPDKFNTTCQLRIWASWLWPFANRSQLAHWARILSAFAGLQIVIQGIGMITGLLIIRSVSKNEYAVYTVAGSALGLLSILSDLGVGGALLAFGGKVWQDQTRLGQLIKAALRLRGWFFLIGFVVASSMFFYLGRKANASFVYETGILVLLLLGAVFQLNYNVWSVVPRLHAQAYRLQKLDLATALVRLSLVAVAAFTFINCIVAIAVNSIGFMLQGTVARRWAAENVRLDVEPDTAKEIDILRLAINQMPNIIFYCLYSQVSIFVISIFGKSSQIAEVGALSRLGAIFSIVTAILSTVVIPRFARLQTRRELIKRYVQVMLVYLGGAAALLGVSFIFPKQLIWLLGSKYGDLESLVVWVVVSALINGLVGTVWAMNSSKGWVRKAWIAIPCMIVSQITAAIFLDLSTTRGAILVGSLPVLAGLPVYLSIAYHGVRKSP